MRVQLLDVSSLPKTVLMLLIVGVTIEKGRSLVHQRVHTLLTHTFTPKGDLELVLLILTEHLVAFISETVVSDNNVII